MTKPFDESVDLGVAPEEQGRVVFAEGEQPAERVGIRVGALAASVDHRGKVGDDRPRGRATRGDLVEARADDGAEPVGHVVVEGELRRILDDRSGKIDRAGRFERQSARHLLEEQDAERPHVARGGGRFTTPQLGRDVGRRAHDLEVAESWLVRLQVARRGGGDVVHVDPCRHAEVQHPQPTVAGDEHVLRLEISVQDAVTMRLVQRLGDGHTVARDLARRWRRVQGALEQVLSFQVLEREVGSPLVLAYRVDRDDVCVVEGCRDGRLPKEGASRRAAPEGLWSKNLQRHFSPEGDVASEVHHPHAPSPEHANELEVIDGRAHPERGRPKAFIRSHRMRLP